jgi:enoyl-CoA hydratase/carnithine racemase
MIGEASWQCEVGVQGREGWDRLSEVQCERVGATLVVRLNRPNQRNAIGDGMLGQLLEAFRMADNEDSIRAVVTTGNGPDFCVGADVNTLKSVAHESGAERPDRGGTEDGLPPLQGVAERVDRLGPGRWSWTIEQFTTPRIAAIEGAAAGGGLCLAALHHFRVASESAKFAAGFGAIGLVPEMGLTQLLPQIVGLQAARRILVLGDKLTASDALRLGLVDKLVDNGAALESALEWSARIASLPPLAVQLTLQLLGEATLSTREQQLRAEYAIQCRLFGTADHREAVSAFVDHRAPTFHGR